MSSPDNESDAAPDGTQVRPATPEQTQIRPPDVAPSQAAATLFRPPPSLGDYAATEIAMAVSARPATDVNSGASKSGRRASDRDATGGERSFEVGSVIRERFVLESLLGRGGMGIVFAALDRRKEEARDPNPHIAIKILNADFRSHPDALIALQREARKAQSLAHPNVVTVFDFDRDGASVYMTMERLRGRSLDAIAREARGRGIGREAALPIIRGIAEGLAYAHRKGIVHSDLKPGNVFVLEDGTPKILDFGIARAVPSATAEKDTFDAGSLGAYTEAYATAEMVEGIDPHPADDVYALGLIAYELLTGQHPYQRHSAPAARDKGLKPATIKILKHREWRALENALSFQRTTRPTDAAEFLKLFFGVTRLQKSLLAAVVVMAMVAGFFGYRTYVEGGPVVPFAQLAPATKQQFNELMSSGDREWQFYEQDKNVMALWDALDQYSEAYRVHPRNRKAVRALERSADAFLQATKDDPAKQQQVAEALAAKSDYLAKYKPILELQSGQ